MTTELMSTLPQEWIYFNFNSEKKDAVERSRYMRDEISGGKNLMIIIFRYVHYNYSGIQLHHTNVEVKLTSFWLS